ncbi:MAG: DUF3822 family protein [Paludibacteraceae bacterium]
MKGRLTQDRPDNNLLVRVHSNGLYYAISDENDVVILQQTINIPDQKLKDVHFLEHFFDQPEFRVLSENVSVVFEGFDYQLIPNELFREEDVLRMFNLQFGKGQDCRLLYNLLPQWRGHLVFRVDKSLVRFLEKKYPEADFEHQVFRTLRKKVTRNTDTVYVNLQKDLIDVVVVKDSYLFLVNSFVIKTNEDICFHILNLFEQLDLDLKNIPLNVFSENTVNEKLINMLKQYVTTVEVG